MTRRIWTSVLVVGLVAALAGIGTYALFTDTASSAGNTLAAGVLDLKVDGSDTMVPMSMDNLAPGINSFYYAYKLYTTENEGDVPGGALTFRIDGVQASGGLNPPPEAAVDPDNSGDLADYIKVRVIFPAYEFSLGTVVGDFTIAELEAGITITDDFAAVAAAHSGAPLLEFEVLVPGTVGNDIMGDALQFDGHLTLEQKP